MTVKSIIQSSRGICPISVNAFLTALALIAMPGPAATARAQAPGVPIESGIAISADAEVLKRANALREAGKLLDQAKVTALLKAPQPAQIALPTPAKKSLPPRKIYQRARGAFVRIGWLYQDADKEPWQMGVAGGYAIADGGIVATAAHVLEVLPDVKQSFLLAVTVDGSVLPVTSILAVDNELDEGIVRVEGFQGRALALNEDVSPGDSVYCFSDPLEERGYYSTGIVNRFYWADTDKGDLKTLQGARKLRFDLTTNWGPGSSGSAVLDRAGNAIGHAWTVSGLQYAPENLVEPEGKAHSGAGDKSVAPKEGTAQKDAKNEGEKVKQDEKKKPESASTELSEGDAGVFQINSAIPARCVRLLVQEMGKPAAGPQVVARIEPAAPKAAAPAPKVDAPSLKVGDPAPRLQCGKFVQGDPIASFEQGKVYVVEFWATWCGPCKESIPHVSQLQTKYKDKGVVVIGQNCGETQEEVAEFVKQMGDKMNFRVALDDLSQDKEGAMSQAWLHAAGAGGIPTAFVVDQQGKLASIGHPMDLEAVVEGVLAGTFDPKKHAELSAAKEKQEGQLETTLAAADLLLKSGKPADALRLIEKTDANLPEAATLKYQILVAQGDSQAAEKWSQQMLETAKDNKEYLESAAGNICEGFPSRAAMELAEKLALRLKEITQGKEPRAWEMLSAIYLHQGRSADALDAITHFESLAADADAKQKAESYRVVALVKNQDAAAAPLTEKLLTANEDQLVRVAELLLAQRQLDTPGLELAGKLAARAAQIAKDADIKRSLRILELRVLLKKKDAAASGQLQDQLFEESKKDDEKLALYVGTLFEASNPTPEEMQAAKHLLTRVNEHSKGKNILVLSMLAQAHLAEGNLEKAIDVQELAVKKTKDAELRKELKEELKELQLLRTRTSEGHN